MQHAAMRCTTERNRHADTHTHTRAHARHSTAQHTTQPKTPRSTHSSDGSGEALLRCILGSGGLPAPRRNAIARDKHMVIERHHVFHSCPAIDMSAPQPDCAESPRSCCRTRVTYHRSHATLTERQLGRRPDDSRYHEARGIRTHRRAPAHRLQAAGASATVLI